MDWMPKKRAEKYLWWKNLSERIEAEGLKIDLPPEEIAAAKARADEQMAMMKRTDDTRHAHRGARSAEATATGINDPGIRAQVRGWRTRPGFAESGMEGILRLHAPQSDFDARTFKPSLKVSIVGGQIKLRYTKGKCDAVAIYGRLRGEAAWTRLGTKTRSPYYDTTPLADPALPEVREYQCRGVINDIEIGQMSVIVTITLT